jgi:hypothetical protein
MKRIKWQDESGLFHYSLVRDSDSDEDYKYGIPDDPPNINDIDWAGVKRDLHNLLVNREIINLEDIARVPGGLRNAVESVLVRRVQALYLQKEQFKKELSK